MRSRMLTGAVVLAVALALAGCSGGGSKAAAGGSSPGAAGASSEPGSAGSGGEMGLPGAPGAPTGGESLASAGASASSSDGSASAASTAGKPVSALLAGISGPVTTANMPTAHPEWIAAVHRSDDTGQSISAKISLNLVALVDEAAKTSDADALVKMCNLCDQQKLRQTLAAKNSSGLTGFQVLSRVLEQTHPAPSRSGSPGWDFPGFSSPVRSTLTPLDRQDQKVLGVSGKTYAGIRAQFVTLATGPNSFAGWTGFGAPNT